MHVFDKGDASTRVQYIFLRKTQTVFERFPEEYILYPRGGWFMAWIIWGMGDCMMRDEYNREKEDCWV